MERSSLRRTRNVVLARTGKGSLEDVLIQRLEHLAVDQLLDIRPEIEPLANHVIRLLSGQGRWAQRRLDQWFAFSRPPLGKDVLLKVGGVELFGTVVRSNENEAAMRFDHPVRPSELDTLHSLISDRPPEGTIEER